MLLTVQREIDFWGDGDRRLNVELDPAMVIRKLWSVCAKAPVVQNGDGTAREVAPASLGADAHAQTIRADDLAQAMVDAAVHGIGSDSSCSPHSPVSSIKNAIL